MNEKNPGTESFSRVTLPISVSLYRLLLHEGMKERKVRIVSIMDDLI